ncbi:hypothetical protein ACTXT7_015357, partial [Hymenolepis weldensis]
MDELSGSHHHRSVKRISQIRGLTESAIPAALCYLYAHWSPPPVSSRPIIFKVSVRKLP